MKEISLFTNRTSEMLFFTLLERNAQIPIKELCRKIPRKMLYRYIKQLSQIQEAAGIQLFTKQASICNITGLPNIVIERIGKISVQQIDESSALVVLSVF
jgi:hypothetical protein